MIKITNGTEIYEVTRGAFETVYKPMGFYEFNGKPVEHSDDVVDDVVEDIVEDVADGPEQEVDDEQPEDDAWCEELEKKPIGQWNKAEVKQYASIKGIDITGTKSINEAKDRIKAAREEW